MALDAQELMDRARRETGLTDFGDAPMREALEQFVASLNTEAGLSEPTLAAAGQAILGTLCERLRLEDWFTRHPEILAQKLALPVNVLGLPRSGTTALSQFLSEDPDMRSIRRWELNTPTPPPDDAVGDADPRIAATRAAFEARDRMMPTMRSMLPVNAEDCSEHNAPMSFTFLNTQAPTLYSVPSYQAWLLAADIRPGYEYLAKVLKLLQWKTPRPRWNLKYPMDVFSLAAFVDVFPEARLAWIHRDPVSTIGSTCSLVSTIREAQGQAVDRKALGPQVSAYLAEGARRAIEDRDTRGLEVADVYNRDLGLDPVGQIGLLYEKLRLEFTPSFEAHLRRRIEERPRGMFGRHAYTLEEFGLSTAHVRREFRHYTDRFDVPLEH